jgi:hypothetical protein
MARPVTRIGRRKLSARLLNPATSPRSRPTKVAATSTVSTRRKEIQASP